MECIEGREEVRRPRCGIFLLALALAACGRQQGQENREPVPPPPPPSIATPRVPAVPVPEADLLMLPAGGENQALVLAAGQTLKGRFAAPRAGSLLALSVQLGTYFDSSTGSLELEVCAGTRCAGASADLRTSLDNQDLTLVFGQPLTVAEDEWVEYRLAKHGGDVDVVVWTYPAISPDAAGIGVVDGPREVGRTARLGAYYAR